MLAPVVDGLWDGASARSRWRGRGARAGIALLHIYNAVPGGHSMFEDTLVDEFTRQATSFNASPAMSSEETLHSLIAMLPLAADQHWLDVACGPGIVSRALAPRVARVTGVDMTPAMIELARAEAGAARTARTSTSGSAT